MFFFIGGIQPRTLSLGTSRRSCPACGYYPLETKRTDQYFSVFFIPLFPVRKGIPRDVCPRCQAEKRGDGTVSEPYPDNGRQLCQRCHKSFSSEFSFCPFCGKPVR